MKKARLSLFLLALAMSVLAVPEAFGGKGGGGGAEAGGTNKAMNQAVTNGCGGIYIWCYYEPLDDCCYGEWEGDCENQCANMCGGPCDYYPSEQ